MQRSRKSIAIVALIALLVAVLIALFDWNWLRGPVSSFLSGKLGRPLRIEGNLHGEFSFKPLFTADNVVLENAPGSDEPLMVEVRQVGVRIDLWSLLRRPVSLPEVTLVTPRVLLERDANGRENWVMGERSKEGDTSGVPSIGTLRIDDGLLRYRDLPAKTNVQAKVETTTAADGSMPMRFNGTGTLRGNEFTVAGSAATLLALENKDRPYRVDVKARAGETAARFNGNFIPSRPDNVDGAMTLEGRDLSQLYPIIPVPLPWTPAYRLSGQLRHEGDLWSFRQMSGRVGTSDLAGIFSVNRKNERPSIEADLVSQQINYKDLGGFVGLPPPNEAAKTRTAEQTKEAAKLSTNGRVLPSKPYEFERLRAADVKVHFRGKRFVASEVPLDDLDAVLDLRNGVLKLEPLNFGLAGGKVASTITMDARDKVIKTKAEIAVRNIDVKQVLPALKPPSGSAGKLGGRAQFSATGNSVADMLAGIDGEIALISSGGEASELAVVLSNLDLARAAQLLLTGDAKSPIRCVVADFVAENGVMDAKTLVVDTEAENIVGSGKVDFTKEQYDLVLKALSKKPSLLALRGPIGVNGSFKSPHVAPQAGPLLARVGASVALGAVLTPIASLLPLIDFGGAPDANCRDLMERARDNVKSRQAAPEVTSRPSARVGRRG
jgi:AsmA family protein